MKAAQHASEEARDKKNPTSQLRQFQLVQQNASMLMMLMLLFAQQASPKFNGFKTWKVTWKIGELVRCLL